MKKLMKIFVALICSLGLVSVAYSAQPEENKPQKKKQAPTAQHPPQPTTGHVTGAGAGPKKTSMGAYEGKKGQTSTRTYEGQTGKAAKGGKVTGAGKLTGSGAGKKGGSVGGVNPSRTFTVPGGSVGGVNPSRTFTVPGG